MLLLYNLFLLLFHQGSFTFLALFLIWVSLLRGRVYPLPPYFNHMGSDLARSMLVFARGKPLGPQGFDWLKLHCINLTGLKKRDSVEDRLRYLKIQSVLQSCYC